MKALPESFYLQNDTLLIARQLLGCVLHSDIDGRHCSGMIVETEAYLGVTDKASHAYGNRKTKRTSVMYQQGGISYVYFTYGMHYLFNVVTNKPEIPHAVLIRALQPLQGEEIMKLRRNNNTHGLLCSGPARLTQALGITLHHNKMNLQGPEIWIEWGATTEENQIAAVPRIGVGYAAEDALLPYRFYIKKNRFISKP